MLALRAEELLRGSLSASLGWVDAKEEEKCRLGDYILVGVAESVRVMQT